MASPSRRGEVDADSASDSVEKLFVIERLFRWLDPWLIPVGFMFGVLFFALGAATAISEGDRVGLLAMGTALLALSRAASATSYARRNRCRCGRPGAGVAEEEAAGTQEG